MTRQALKNNSAQGWQFEAREFLLPKSGHAASECEDAIGINRERARFAIADGATEAFDAGRWASLLAHGWVEAGVAALEPEEFRDWVASHAQRLHDSWKELSLSWYAEEKARDGSFAAFVGMELNLDEPSWKAVALGDACLIHCRNNAVLKAMPVSHHEGFNSAPTLVASRAQVQDATIKHVVTASGSIEEGDVLLLLSDAAASWYLLLAETVDETRARFEALLRAGQDEDLARLFESERLAGRIKDDDIAVIRVEVGGR